jgi:hypothetical protein
MALERTKSLRSFKKAEEEQGEDLLASSSNALARASIKMNSAVADNMAWIAYLWLGVRGRFAKLDPKQNPKSQNIIAASRSTDKVFSNFIFQSLYVNECQSPCRRCFGVRFTQRPKLPFGLIFRVLEQWQMIRRL